MPRISVLLPVYNAELYVGDTIRSVLDQTYRDFELIIVNDGSSDQSLQVIQSFQDNRIIIINQENRGLPGSLNNAAKIAQGEYLARIDADDICLKDRFEKQIEYLDAHLNIGILGSAMEYIDEKGTVIGRSFPVCNPSLIKKCLQRYSSSIIAHPSVMMRRSVFETVGGYSDVLGSEDMHLWRKLLRKGVRFQNLADPLISYRLLSSAISERIKSEAYLSLLNVVLDTDHPTEDQLQQLAVEYKKCKPGSSLRVDTFRKSRLQQFCVALRQYTFFYQLIQWLGCSLGYVRKSLRVLSFGMNRID